MKLWVLKKEEGLRKMSHQILNKIPEPVQISKRIKHPFHRGVHLNTDVEITAHNNSNECRKRAQEGRNMAR